ncbi:MAG: hypothetical protein ACREMQ_20785 [Longimicrobiales bacterium]
MKQHDPLHSVLQEWEAPEPSPAMDARVRAAYRTRHQASLWERFWSVRVSIPVPALAALLLIAAALWLQFRPRLPVSQPATVTPPTGGYTTRIETAGFQPLPDGAIRVIRAGELKQ